MKLLLDMDGPLADFDRHFWDVAHANRFTIDVDHPDQQTRRYFTDHMPVKSERALMRRFIEQTRWFSDLPVTPGAVAGVEQLIASGVDVWVVTKPLEANPSCWSDKAVWLHQHFPMLDGRLIMAPDKSMVVGDVLLDDAPIEAWYERATWLPVLFDAPFNRDGSKFATLRDGTRVRRWTWGDPIDDLT